jgi:Fe2+ or Zn2+ uptake regulation protein
MKLGQDKLKKFLKDRGHKITPNRLAVLEVLQSSNEPLSAKDIRQKIRGIDYVTLYRTLEHFRETGLVSKISLSDKKAYYEYTTKHHHHIVCTGCGVIEELSDCAIPKSKLLGMKTGKFPEVSRHSLEFFGTCSACYDPK